MAKKSRVGQKAWTTEKFISEARKVHGDKYDYSRVVYINSRTPVIIGCPIHGFKEQKPGIHLTTNGCKDCGYAVHGDKMKGPLYDTATFIEKSKQLHDDIDYSITEFRGAEKPVSMICKIHNIPFTVAKAANHVSRTHPQRGCKLCVSDKVKERCTMTLDEFLLRAAFVHGETYSYDRVKWVNANTEIVIVCKVHGPFRQLPVSHLKYGCRKCGDILRGKNKAYTQEEFVALARTVHGDRYTYEHSVYKGMDEDITITCPKHKDFVTTPHNFIHAASGCPKCKRPRLEGIVSSWLKESGIAFEEQKNFPWLKNVRLMKLDFYLPEYNIAIECQGDQHFKNSFERPIFIRQDYIAKQSERDKLKHDQCEAHGIPILYFANKDSCCIPDTYLGPIVTDKIELLFQIHLLSKH